MTYVEKTRLETLEYMQSELAMLNAENERLKAEIGGFTHLADLRQAMVDTADENVKLRSAVADCSDALEIAKVERTQLMKLTKDALAAWDSDQHSRTGKLLIAMTDSEDFNLDDRIKEAIKSAFEEAGEERFIAEDSQLVNGVWLNPAWGCDTLQHFIDVLRDCDA